jgi:hypothetical protein
MTPVKHPDLKAPRFRHEFVNLMTNKLLDKIKSKTSKANDVTLADVRKIMNTFNGMMWNHVIESRDGIELPESLGSVYVVTCPPPKRKNIDMKKSIELGVAVTHQNWDTDGHIGKVIYSSYGQKYRFKNSELWSFKTGRDFKRSVSSRYPENWTVYKKIEKHLVISSQIKSMVKKEIVLNRSEHIPDNYNEFDLD